VFKAERYLANSELLTVSQEAHHAHKSSASLLENLNSNQKTAYLIRHMRGLASSDKLTHGSAQGALVVIAGRPSMGQTS